MPPLVLDSELKSHRIWCRFIKVNVAPTPTPILQWECVRKVCFFTSRPVVAGRYRGVTGVIVTPNGSNRLRLYSPPSTNSRSGLVRPMTTDNRPKTQDHVSKVSLSVSM